MSTGCLLQIPMEHEHEYEYEDEHKDGMSPSQSPSETSRESSPSETFHDDNLSKIKNITINTNIQNNINIADEGIVIIPSSPSMINYQQILPSQSQQHSLNINIQTLNSLKLNTTNNNNVDDLIRTVSNKECSIFKNNIMTMLKDNDFDIKYQFNLNEFVSIFKKILPSSQDDQITKLFDLLSPSDNDIDKEQDTLLSFDTMLNNDKCFNQLLEAMGCCMEQNLKMNKSTIMIV